MRKEEHRITGISVEGFKSICSEQSIEIRPLTLLAGANSSGKSSIMQPLLLMKQTIESPSDPGALLLDGPNVRFTAADQLLSKVGGKPCASKFAVMIELGTGRRLRNVFHKKPGEGFDVREMRYREGKEEILLDPSMTHDDVLKILPSPFESFHTRIEKEEKRSYHWVVQGERCFLGLALTGEGDRQRRPMFPPFLSPSVSFVPLIQAIIHLPGLRGNPRRTCPKTAGGPNFPGTFETYVASVVAQWQHQRSERLNDLGAALEEMGLTWKVKAQAVDDTQVELRVGRLTHGKRGGAQDLVNIADVGFGVSQSLPVLVALLVAQPGQLVYLEQPEIHLHPNAQRRLATILRETARRGVVVVVETHSSLLLRAIQTLVAQDQLEKELVKLHWFQRGEDGSTTITSADVDETGAYGNWPEDFDETALESSKAYLDAAEARGARS